MTAAKNTNWLRFLKWIGATDLTEQEIEEFEKLTGEPTVQAPVQEAGERRRAAAPIHSLPSPLDHETGLIKKEEFLATLQTLSGNHWTDGSYALGAIGLASSEEIPGPTRTKARTIMQLCLRPSDVATEWDQRVFLILFEGANDVGATRALERIGREIAGAVAPEIQGVTVAAHELSPGESPEDLVDRLLLMLQSGADTVLPSVDSVEPALPSLNVSYARALASAHARRESVQSVEFQELLDDILTALARIETELTDPTPERARELVQELRAVLGSQPHPETNAHQT